MQGQTEFYKQLTSCWFVGGHASSKALRGLDILCCATDRDEMLGKICACLDTVGGDALIISDHGNCEQMYIGDTENPHTYHTLNPVPCILYSDREKVSISSGSLIDIAPTILELLGKDKPKQMTGKSLLQW